MLLFQRHQICIGGDFGNAEEGHQHWPSQWHLVGKEKKLELFIPLSTNEARPWMPRLLMNLPVFCIVFQPVQQRGQTLLGNWCWGPQLCKHGELLVMMKKIVSVRSQTNSLFSFSDLCVKV